jgi:hypothetical protein
MASARSYHRTPGSQILRSTPRYVLTTLAQKNVIFRCVSILHSANFRKYTKPECNADLSQRFHFKTRKQELNSVEGSEYSTIRQVARPPLLI